MKIVLATHNAGKIREFQKAFSEIGWDAVPVAEIADVSEPEETGTTFEENALLKARYYAKAVNYPVLSDDSGIIADALGDRPGIYSARYAGVHGMMRLITGNWWKTLSLTKEKTGKGATCA